MRSRTGARNTQEGGETVTAINAEHGHHELIRRIAATGRRWRRRAALAGLLRVASIALAVIAVTLVLDALVGLPPGVRVPLALAIVLFVIVGLARAVARPLLARIDPVRIAARIDEHHPELGELLESSAELWDKRGKGRHGYSIELIDALISKTVAEAADVDFASGERTREGRRLAWVSAVLIVAAVLGIAALGPRVGPAFERLLNPFAAASVPEVVITVEPGDATIIAGDDLPIVAAIEGPAVGPPVLRFEHEGEAPLERAMTAIAADGPDAAGDGAGAPGDSAARARYHATLADVRSDVVYSVRSGEVESDRYTVGVIERPFVTGIKLDYRFPSYSGLLPRTVEENNGDITALVGTLVRVTVNASKPLEKADLVFESGTHVPLARLGASSFTGDVRVRESTTYAIEILDADQLRNDAPPSYSIVAVKDEYPIVAIVEPGKDMEVPRGMTLPLIISAIDDYGVSKLAIRYSIEGLATEGVFEIGGQGDAVQRDVVKETVWDLAETAILPGTILVYFAEVTDNDSVSGPKTSRSESYLLRFPSMAELYSEITGEQEDMLQDLDDLVGDQEELREEFEEIEEDLKSDPEIDWQDEERVEAALDRQEELVEEVSSMADRMSDLTEKMSDSDRVALDALEKTEEITRLLDEIATKEMRELIERIRQAMSEISPEQVSQAMQEMEISQDDYMRRLEQTLNLLRRAKAEQQLTDIANRADELARQQEKLAEQAQKAPSGEQCESMSKEQQKLSEMAEQLRKDLEKAIEEMSKVDREAAEEMRKALEEMDASELAEKMEKARQKLTEQKPGEAGPMCQSAASDLRALFTRLSTCSGGMACSIQQRDREATLRAIDELLGVSCEQEEIVTSVEERSRIPRDEIVELVAKEADLAESMSSIADRMFDTSKDSFTIDPSVYRAFGLVNMYMSRAAARIAAGGSSAGAREAREALGRVNGLVVSLLTANQSNSRSQSGSALDQLMQQLKQMAQDQSDLSNMTEQLKQQLEQLGMGAQLERQLAEMKGRQERILEEARRLAKEFGDRREILGRLDDTVGEIEKTLEEMDRSGASQETVDRQKRILSRLLDAQRSLRRRDYTRERRSRTGDEYIRSDPPGLPDDLTRASQELREDLLRAMQRDYPSEYRDLIRAYFEGLSSDIESGESEGVEQ